MTVQAVITQRKSLDRNVIGKNGRLLCETQTAAPSLGARLSIGLQDVANASDHGNAVGF